MERVVDGTVPRGAMRGEAGVQWEPFSNRITGGTAGGEEGAERYRYLLDNFHAYRQEDPYQPIYDTAIRRAFDEAMQVPLEKVEALFETLLSSGAAKRVGALIATRLGRNLEPFDIW